jgi:hypothetical protein
MDQASWCERTLIFLTASLHALRNMNTKNIVHRPSPQEEATEPAASARVRLRRSARPSAFSGCDRNDLRMHSSSLVVIRGKADLLQALRIRSIRPTPDSAVLGQARGDENSAPYTAQRGDGVQKARRLRTGYRVLRTSEYSWSEITAEEAKFKLRNTDSRRPCDKLLLTVTSLHEPASASSSSIIRCRFASSDR